MKRRGFTLTELLVVVGILLLLSTLSLAVYSNNRSSERTRSAARIAQSAFLGAKDRAMNAKDFRGVRLTLDTQNSNLVSGFAYVQPIQHDPYAAGSIQLERQNDGSGNPLTADVLIVHGATTGAHAVDWSFVAPKFSTPGQIRIPSQTGQWYAFSVDSAGQYALAPGNQYLRLIVPFTASQSTPGLVGFSFTNPATNSCDIQFGFDVVPFHQPIPLSSGIVIDLRYCSQNIQSLASVGPVDVVFSPRGTIAGAMGGSGAIYLCLRSLEDATLNLDPSNPACQGECLLLAVNPQTGLVQTYAADLTDANADGIVDNLFRFAQAGKAAGR